jgi:ADP-ribosyl-[dinitrogen reductase] hydrolase
MQSAISLGGNTDSIGAITGALAGACYGIPKKFLEILHRESRIVAMIKENMPRG